MIPSNQAMKADMIGYFLMKSILNFQSAFKKRFITTMAFQQSRLRR